MKLNSYLKSSPPAPPAPAGDGQVTVRRLSLMDEPPPPSQKASVPDGDLMGGSLLMGSTRRGDRSMESKRGKKKRVSPVNCDYKSKGTHP